MSRHLKNRQIRIYFPYHNTVNVIDKDQSIESVIENGIQSILDYIEDHIFQYPLSLIVQHPDENGNWKVEKRLNSYQLRNIIYQRKN